MAAGSEDVKRVQQALKEQGQDPGPIDGIIGPKTKQALRAFWAREREQNRKANRKLLAGIGRVLAKSFVFLMLIWALLIALGIL